jgi:hypothetical protein
MKYNHIKNFSNFHENALLYYLTILSKINLVEVQLLLDGVLLEILVMDENRIWSHGEQLFLKTLKLGGFIMK